MSISTELCFIADHTEIMDKMFDGRLNYIDSRIELATLLFNIMREMRRDVELMDQEGEDAEDEIQRI